MKRRISYTIPPPIEPVPHLRLPDPGTSRFGLSGPLLIPIEGGTSQQRSTSQQQVQHHRGRHLPVPRHPRHRLGVSSLALDTCTRLSGNGTPEGILYSGGRDGMVNSWDLHVPMRSREKERRLKQSRGGYEKYRWEIMTGWADDVDEDGDEFSGDGDVLGEVTLRKRRGEEGSELPYEKRWEMRKDASGVQPATFRQCAELHTEWINDIALCNYNQTVVSASSDGTIKTWNPYGGETSILGQHEDYVRCLTACREQNWIASGSFDRTIKLWDLGHSSTNPVVTLQPPDAAKDPKTSVYALAADLGGHVIASGSPERIVRLWDPRSGKGTGKLVGHTDNIRAILVSDDGRYLLTASTDASIKLWSLSSPQRCLHTFTHHTDSVWSLYSSHPSLETFYSGDKNGLVCRVDVSGVGAFDNGDMGSSMNTSLTAIGSNSGIGMDYDAGFGNGMDIGQGECILVAAVHSGSGLGSSESGVDRIVVLDDQLLWTASGTSSEIRRWRLPPKLTDRRARGRSNTSSPNLSRDRSRSTTTTQEDDDNGVKLHDSPGPMHVSLPPTTPPRQPRHHSHHHQSQSPHPSPRPPHPHFSSSSSSHLQRGSPSIPQRPYVSSLIRLPYITTFVPKAHGKDTDSMSLASHFRAQSPNPSLNMSHSHSSYTNRPTEQEYETAELELPELASDATPFNIEPDAVIPGDAGLVRSVILNDRVHALTVDTAGEVGVWDIVRGICLGVYRDPCRCGHESKSPRSPTRSPGSTRNPVTRSPCHCHPSFSPREALENVRSQIEGEGAVVPPWATCDTKAGALSIHLNLERCFDAEVYADEVGFPRAENGEDVKLNVGRWVLKNLFLGFIREEQRIKKKREASGSNPPTNNPSPEPPHRSPAKVASVHPVVSSPTLIPAVPPPSLMTLAHKTSSPLLTPLIPLASLNNQDQLPSIPQSPDVMTPIGSMSRRPTLGRLRSASVAGEQDIIDLAASPTPHPKEASDYFSGVVSRPSESATEETIGKESTASGAVTQTPVTPSGGLMTRLKSFGKTRKNTMEAPPPTPSLPATAEKEKEKEATEDTSDPASTEADTKAKILGSSLTPPPSAEAPVHTLPSNMTVTISEDHTTVYRGTVSNTGHDVKMLEEVMPLWLMECLLLNKLPPAPAPVKVSFILLPWQGEGLSEEEKLPELLNITQSKLTASRWLRVRKLTQHVQDKLDKLATTSPSSARTSLESNAISTPTKPNPGKQPAEDLYEILCNEVVLPLDMTLAAVRHYVWRQVGELIMHYRLKKTK
ncbi:hypothetical protein V5O48_008524 [Marasmius crinis-equi]|uniref:WD40 repeat-like protein n=1 Tax=Marasmius crinis-equi TaxID=585013 RepID=A0ABR3FDM4_9AGAR